MPPPIPPYNNTNYGSLSLDNNITGSNNSAFGCGGLQENATGWNNTAVGVSALLSNVDASCNTGIGADALHFNETGEHNTSVGAGSMCNYKSGSLNTAVGSSALEGYNTTDASGNGNVAVGAQALYKNRDQFNTAVGTYALLNNTTLPTPRPGGDVMFMANTAVGAASLYSNDTGYYNCAFGAASLQSNTIGIENLAVGAACMEQNIDGSCNVAVGNAALRYSNGHANTAIGYHSIRDGGNGDENTAVGFWSLNKDAFMLNVASITFSGDLTNPITITQVLLDNNNPIGNVALGYKAGSNNTNGDYNTYVGWQADFNGLLECNYSVAVGSEAKVSTTNSTAIGAKAESKNVNSTAIGYLSKTTADYQIMLGTSSEKVYIPGDCDISGNCQITGKCDISGNCTAASYSTPSDSRIKENVKTLGEEHTIDKLRPVTYLNKIANRQDLGLIAHELQEHYPMLVNGEKDGDTLQTVNYIGLIAVLINEIQMLKNRVKEIESLM